ncbi:MAG: hypothetical protein BAJALOKI3v1_40016 [Promethearchaeota archaeon]|nr:MAG: hypothetical protein BAJALOKI3v1_40016 [Candidatus Lokiarchaeota archaeon]
MAILGIDLGTQTIKAALLEPDGKVLGLAKKAQKVDSPHPGWAQQQPKLWWQRIKESIQILIKQFNTLPEIKGICVCGQMHGPVGLDKNGMITTEWTQIWSDKRSEEVCKEIRKKYNEQELAKITGNPITTGWPGVKVSWIKQNQPKIYDKSKWFLVPKDFINFKLTGKFYTDPSEASGTYLYDTSTNDYSNEMGKILGIDITKFAKITDSYEIIGEIKSEVAKELGLPNNVPVLTGGGDFIVSLLGLGLIRSDSAVDMTGTSTLFVVKRKEPILNPGIQNLRHVINGWTPFTMLDCGGLSMTWCRDFLNSVKEEEFPYEEMIKMASKIDIGSEGLLFYPYLLGERRPENVLARGSFFGITLNHQAAHFARSIMEGVSFAIGKDAQLFKEAGVDIDEVFCVGGGTNNKLLYNIKANVMNIPQIIINEPEASLRGNALLAAYGLKIIDDIEKTAKIEDSKKEVIFPNETAVKKYRVLQNDFMKMYNHLLGYWKI